MNDAEQLLRDELERLAPAAEIPTADWSQVRRAARQRPGPRRLAVVVALLLVAVAAPTLALSASVRNLLGLGAPPSPDYSRAQVAVSATIPGGRIARVWTAPSTTGGQCEFVTIDPRGKTPHPARMSGGGACTIGREPFQGPLSWSFSHGATPIIDGRVARGFHPARVELRWHGGSQQLTYANGFFVAAAPALANPPFRQLPYDLVAVDAAGRVAARSRIPTSFLYTDWKQVEPQLHRYRILHGCDKSGVWRCRSR